MDVENSARRAGNSRALRHAVQVGLVSYGVVHLLIAWIALRLAWGSAGGKAASQQGALKTLAGEPGGQLLLWVVAVGFAALTLWQLTEAVWGHRHRDGAGRVVKRLASLGKAVMYAYLGVTAGRTAAGASSGGGTDGPTARLMGMTGGRLLVAAVGLAVIGVGIYLVVKGLARRFTDDLEPEATSGRPGSLVVVAGAVGYAVKGVALGIVGALFVWAAWTYDPQKAGGLDAALTTLLDAPVGRWLLSAAAVGIGCFGLYCFGWARSPRTAD